MGLHPGHRARPSRRPLALNVEPLEDRVVPSASLLLDLVGGPTGSHPRNLSSGGGRLWFQSGSTLWTSDGAADGTIKLPLSAAANDPTPFAGSLYFGAAGLYVSDGTAPGTSRVGPSLRTVSWLTASGGKLFFVGHKTVLSFPPVTEGELWVSDGTADGTALLKDLDPGTHTIRVPVRGPGRGGPGRPGPIRYITRTVPNSSSPAELTGVDGVVVFAATTAATGRELWRTDGTAAGTVLVKDIAAGQTGSNPRSLTPFDGDVYFSTTGGLWKTDGTDAGTTLVQALPASPQNLKVMNGSLYFTIDDELWKSDGTSSGTALIADTAPGVAGEMITGLTAVDGTLYFSSATPGAGRELWVSDGTPQGTSQVKDINPGALGSIPFAAEFVGYDGKVYFPADDGSHGLELWQSDGTPDGTVMVMDVNPGVEASSPSGLTVSDGVLYFSAYEPVFGQELWRVPGDPRPGLFMSFASANEGHDGTHLLTFTATLTAATTDQVTVNYATIDAAAVAGDDYEAATGTLTFAPGETTQTVTVQVIGDRLLEGDEWFMLALSEASNAVLYTKEAQGTILDDEPVMAVDYGWDVEGNEGNQAMTFSFTLSRLTTDEVTVNYATADGTALAGEDYEATSGTLTFAPGETTQTLTVQVIGDRVFEEDEQFTLALSGATNAVLDTEAVVGTVQNDEPLIVVSGESVREGRQRQRTRLRFTVSFAEAYDLPVSVNFATADGTAKARKDYQPASGAVTFTPGETSKVIQVRILADDSRERLGTERFFLDLFGATFGVVQERGTGWIEEDD